MKRQIILQDKSFDYILRKSKRAKRMRLSVYCDGLVVVTLPNNLEISTAERFIQEKTNWLLSKINYFRKFKFVPRAKYSRKDYLKHKNEAYLLAKERTDYFNQFYGYKFNRINIRNQKTRWGSCSRKGNLNFNFKILFLSERLRDYIIVHELCHLKELNHSVRFWSLVAITFPQWADIKKELSH